MTASTDSVNSAHTTALEADAAYLRRAFSAAVEGWQSGNCGEMSAAQRAVWAKLYAAVRDHTAGLAILAELQRLRERDELRQVELADTDATLADMIERYGRLKDKLDKWASQKGEAA